MVTVTKTVRFDAAHVLTNHAGLCRNLHGHTYRVEVSVAGEADGGDGMVIDFKDLKSLLAETVCARFDHAFIYNTGSEAEREIAEGVARPGAGSAAAPLRSAAERPAPPAPSPARSAPPRPRPRRPPRPLPRAPLTRR